MPKKKKHDSARAPILFYGVKGDHAFLSNMYVAVFEVDNEVFNCNEQFFQAAKAELFGDLVSKKAIMKQTDPVKQKALGKKVKGFDDKEWAKYRYRVLLKANYLKFTQSKRSPALRQQLIETGDHELVEASTDKIWGAGMTMARAKKEEGGSWPGTNLQGHILMAVRKAVNGGKLTEGEPTFKDIE